MPKPPAPLPEALSSEVPQPSVGSDPIRSGDATLMPPLACLLLLIVHESMTASSCYESLKTRMKTATLAVGIGLLLTSSSFGCSSSSDSNAGSSGRSGSSAGEAAGVSGTAAGGSDGTVGGRAGAQDSGHSGSAGKGGQASAGTAGAPAVGSGGSGHSSGGSAGSPGSAGSTGEEAPPGASDYCKEYCTCHYMNCASTAIPNGMSCYDFCAAFPDADTGSCRLIMCILVPGEPNNNHCAHSVGITECKDP